MSRSWVAGLCAGLTALFAVAIPLSAQARLSQPRVDSDEYRKSWPLEAIGARAAYAQGLSGAGVRIAVVDCGVAGGQRELLRNISKDSTDLIARRDSPILQKHGVYVADPLVAALDGRGMVGVAYNATIIEIRADIDGGGKDGECAFRKPDLARALDYAADHKAQIVVLPLQAEHRLGEAFETALERLVATGAVVVVSAGNNHADQPAWPARYAADPKFARAMVVAGAETYSGEIAAWSNKAGPVGARYILAPGQWVLTDCGRKCQLTSGTSLAAPYVAGAIALMMQAHPEIGGPEAAERVLAAARDAGRAGVDPVYGRGMLDLNRAFGGGATGVGTGG